MIAIKNLATVLSYIIGLCGVTPLFPWLTMFPRMVLLFGLITGLLQDFKGNWQIKPWMQNIVSTPIFIYYALQFSSNNPVQPVISVLAIMLAVRLSGEKTVRHSKQIYALSIFCLASSTLYDLSPVFLLYLGLLLFMVAIALILLTFQSQDVAMLVTKPDLKKILISGLLIPVISLPLLIFFFPIMPRTQLPIWNFLNPSPSGTSGYSEAVEPGSKSNVSASHSLVFRAEMPRQEDSVLYWRGTVFNWTDGNKWTRTLQIPPENTGSNKLTVNQVIFPEPSVGLTLFSLDRPVTMSLQRIKLFPDGVFELSRAGRRRISYSADSQTGGIVTQLNHINRRFYLQLPEHLPTRLKELSSRLIRAGNNDRKRIEYLENVFRLSHLRYSTNNLPVGDRVLEKFLFEIKQGNCEYFASSFALLLRSAGVPCRLVGGFFGGEYNKLGGYYLITEDKAHVWVEAYIEGEGWIRIDPSSFAVNSGEVWSKKGSKNLLLRLTMAIDSFNHAWNRSVISYDLEQQISFASQIGSGFRGIQPSIILRNIMPYLVGCLLLVSIYFTSKRMSLFKPRELRVLKCFLKIVKLKFNISAEESGCGLFEVATSVNCAKVSEFVEIYAAAVYHDRRLTDKEYKKLLKILKDMQG